RYDLKFSGSHGARRGQNESRSEQDGDRPFAHETPLLAVCGAAAVAHPHTRATIRASCGPPKGHPRAGRASLDPRHAERPSKARGRNNKFQACGANLSQSLRRRAMARRAATLIVTVTTGSAVCPG